jgi:outer membrane protein OmpA-like peptidoglycan-associated protein
MIDRRCRYHAISLKFFAVRICATAGLFLSGCASVNTFVVLLPEEGGAPSAVSVGEGSGGTVLDKPYSAAAVDTKGRVETKSITAEEAKRTFAEALAAQPPQAVSFTLYFETNSTEVTSASRAALDALLTEVAQRQAVEVQVTGHTDRVGSTADNDRLSLQRAEAVRAMLVQRGIKADFIRAVGRGEREPLIPTSDEQAEPRNRRVEITVR